MTVSFTVPLPPSGLLPNKASGRDWRPLHALRRLYRDECYVLAKQAHWSALQTPVRTTLVFVLPDNRVHDADNLIAAMKSGIDGIARALLGGKDDARHMKLVTDVIVVPLVSEVRVTIEELR